MTWDLIAVMLMAPAVILIFGGGIVMAHRVEQRTRRQPRAVTVLAKDTEGAPRSTRDKAA